MSKKQFHSVSVVFFISLLILITLNQHNQHQVKIFAHFLDDVTNSLNEILMVMKISVEKRRLKK